MAARWGSESRLGLSLVIPLALALVRCGSLDTDRSTLPSPAPEVVRTVPADLEIEVDPGARLTVQFSKPIDAGSLTSNSVQLLQGGLPVPLTCGYQPMTLQALLTPAAPLAAGTAYELRVTTAVRDEGGRPLPADHLTYFITAAEPGHPVPDGTYLHLPAGMSSVTDTLMVRKGGRGVIARGKFRCAAADLEFEQTATGLLDEQHQFVLADSTDISSMLIEGTFKPQAGDWCLRGSVKVRVGLPQLATDCDASYGFGPICR